MSEIVLDKALGFMERGEYEEALRNLKFYLQENPMNPDAVCARGMCHLELGNLRRGKKDILAAVNMGSKAAEEILISERYNQFLIRTNTKNGVKGFLLLFCVVCYISSFLNFAYYTKSNALLIMSSSVWCIATGVMLQFKMRGCVFNAKLLLIANIVISLIGILDNNYKAIGYAFWQIVWLLYFFTSKRVKETYGIAQYQTIEVKPQVDKKEHLIARKAETAAPTPKLFGILAELFEFINFKVVAVILSIVVLVVSGILLKRSFDMKASTAERFSYVPAGDNKAFKIDTLTGEKWLVTPYGERKIENRVK